MQFAKYKKPVTLGILFFLPVTFLLMLYPSTHNYNPLDIVNENVYDLSAISTETDEQITLRDHITVLAFLGKHPNDKALAALNLKEMIYDKFKGFKKFQIIAIVNNNTTEEVSLLKKELSNYEPLTYWHFLYVDQETIDVLFKSLSGNVDLDTNNATDQVFIIDKELKQRGRIDDREKNEIEAKKPVYGLFSYNCVEVAELKNKMGEDMRILFTEYRQKRKGDFNSTIRRAADLNANEK